MIVTSKDQTALIRAIEKAAGCTNGTSACSHAAIARHLMQHRRQIIRPTSKATPRCKHDDEFESTPIFYSLSPFLSSQFSCYYFVSCILITLVSFRQCYENQPTSTKVSTQRTTKITLLYFRHFQDFILFLVSPPSTLLLIRFYAISGLRLCEDETKSFIYLFIYIYIYIYIYIFVLRLFHLVEFYDWPLHHGISSKQFGRHRVAWDFPMERNHRGDRISNLQGSQKSTGRTSQPSKLVGLSENRKFILISLFFGLFVIKNGRFMTWGSKSFYRVFGYLEKLVIHF